MSMSKKSTSSSYTGARRFTFGTINVSALEKPQNIINFQSSIKPGNFAGSDNELITVNTCGHPRDSRTDCKVLHIPFNSLRKYQCDIEKPQKWLTLTGKNGKMHRFPLETALPKVQMVSCFLPKHLPRDVEVERRRRNYNKTDLVEELAKAGLDKEDLLPTEEQYYLLSGVSFKHFLPLSFFDDTDYDCHSPETWLKLGVVEETEQSFPLPAKAYLPLHQSLIQYKWQNAAVLSYDSCKDKWTVMELVDELVYEVPKIQILFMAENPFHFVERVKQAAKLRNDAEIIIKMETLVDCVLWQDISEDRFYPHRLVEKLMENVQTHDTFREQLRTEIYKLYEHLMTCYELEKFLKLFPHEFPDLKADILRKFLPKRYRSNRSENESKILKSMKINMVERKNVLLRQSLFYTAEGIEAMLNVAADCQHIETLTLFACNLTKPLTLADFLNFQQAEGIKTSNYLKEKWPYKIAYGIVTALRPLGKGWLDISLSNWSVYQMCKISRLMLQTKLRMQESMQLLLEKSIKSFVGSLTDPCKQFLQLDMQYQWSSDFKITEFPCNKPLFSLVLSINEEGEVTYSTQPEEFAGALKGLFKQSLESTCGVRQIDRNCLFNLRFANDLFIRTVELVESLYVECCALLQQCYKKAIYPLISYAHKYDRFVKFHLLHIPTYMDEYKAAERSSMQVKIDILEHKRHKEELRDMLPESITIGPFLVVVEPFKQQMIRKRVEIIKKIFQYYVDRMLHTNERLLERSVAAYNKINNRPQSIEQLYIVRDFALTVPNLIDSLRADIQIMWIEYDMLDSFFYNLPNHQFALKWAVYAWPKLILDRLTTLREEQTAEIEEFKMLHIGECISFEERLQSLNDEVQQFSLRFDPHKVTEVAVEIKKTWKLITVLQTLGDNLRHRQQLFDLEEFSLAFLNSITEGFLPYKKLWLACQDLVKLEEATLGNPLLNIELDAVSTAMEVIRESLYESLRVFVEKTEVQQVANYFLEVLHNFIPKYNAIKDLRNENWLFPHWQELSARAGLDIKYSAAMNFQYCMRKGIMDHLELVHEISKNASNDAQVLRIAHEEEERRKEEERLALLKRKVMRKCRTDIL